MGILSINDAIEEWDDFHKPWEVGSWSDKINNAQFGSPFHGLRAGHDLWEMLSPTVHIKDRIEDLNKNGTDGHLGRTREQFHDYTKEAWDNNWPVLAAYAGGVAAGAGGGGAAGGGAGSGSAAGGGGILSAGDAAALEAASASAGMSGTSGASAGSGMGMSAPASGFNWSGAAQQGLGLLGQAAGQQPQQQPVAVSAPPQQQKDNSLQQRVAMQRRIQQLRMKQRKTLAEQQELQELMRNAQGQQ